MKTTALFVIALTFSAVFAIKMDNQANLAMESSLEKLKKTGWGQVAVAFIELQMTLGGPLDELGTAFRSLIADLNFKISTEKEDYAVKLAEHKVIHKEIDGRIKSAEMDIGVSNHKLDNFLYPKK